MVWRARLLAGVLLLAAVAFRQSPGLVVPDTKLDLTANPSGFLARALHMWDPQGAFGQLQNQAYGYLFPVGPFHWLLTTAGVPAWIVQRLWWTVVLATAFLGLWRLAGALGLGTPWARFAGALLYALTPRSSGRWPSPRSRSGRSPWRRGSSCPWSTHGAVLGVADQPVRIGVRVRRGHQRGRDRRDTGVAHAVVRDPPRRAARAWLVCRVADVGGGGVLWWLVPLVLLGRHSPPFLDWIEDAPVTTAFASPFEALRGTTQWLNYLTGPGGPSWPAGWQFVTRPSLIVLTAVVFGLGLAGIRLAPRPGAGVPDRFGGHGGPGHSRAHRRGLAGGAGRPVPARRGPRRGAQHAQVRAGREGAARPRVDPGLTATARAARRACLAPWLAPVMAVSCILATGAPALAGNLARPEGYRRFRSTGGTPPRGSTPSPAPVRSSSPRERGSPTSRGGRPRTSPSRR